ncbi:MAG: hypothetical protein EOP38_03335 [Rubrivivax sp.]|nr:MAG: hypothetical protein EOP38_03335 [Rubrivivax sp.]
MKSPKTPSSGPRQGNTLPRVKGAHAPRLPHERDESADSQLVEEPQPVIQQAHDDLERGLQDTDRAAPMDEVYNRTLRSGKGRKTETKPPR